MSATPDAFAPFAQKMTAAGLPEVAIQAFRHAFGRLESGDSGMLGEDELEPVRELPTLDELGEVREAGQEALTRCVVIKLNGGLATSMGMTQAKSLLPAREGLSFLEILVRHVLHQRRELEAPLPILLMNSFRTRDDCLRALDSYPDLNGNLPRDFLQHRVPKVDADTHAPASWPGDPELEWCPPGHGDLYAALSSSGALDALLGAGFEYAFVSNADNLGATLDPRVLGYVARESLPFLMEVTGRTHGDRKGGHLARLRGSGTLTLRESAQCAEGDRGAFEDVERHPFFNTNNLWIRLPALAASLEASGGAIPLPVIQNRKHLDPRDVSSPAVIQLETAMGAALSVFPGAAAVAVPRDRFAPVKTTADLLALRSDAYTLSDDYRVVPAAGSRARELRIDLDPRYYTRIDDFEARFAHGAPSLAACDSLRVRGDVYFGPDVRCVGEATIEHDGEGTFEVAAGSEVGSDASGR